MNIIKHTLLFIITYILFTFFVCWVIILGVLFMCFVIRDLKPLLDFNFLDTSLRLIFLISLILSIQFYSSEHDSLLTPKWKWKL